jgi:hypothetical protein
MRERNARYSAEADVGPAALTMHMAAQVTRFGSSMGSQANDRFSVQIGRDDRARRPGPAATVREEPGSCYMPAEAAKVSIPAPG